MHARLCAAAEAAAGEHGLELHTVERQPEHFSDRLVLPGLQLAAETRERALTIPLQEAVERLHRCMREVREDELRLDHARRPRERGFCVAMRAGDAARLARKRAVLLDDLLAAALFGGGFVPGDAQTLAALHR